MKWLLRLSMLAVLAAVALGAWLAFGNRGGRPTPRADSAVAPATLRDPALIARGEYLATLGDCATCHTAQGGARYAGGRMTPTPFGDIPAPNLTPDRETGLGEWSFEDFWRALHHGQGRDGRPLYPAFPYTSFTKVGRDDALAMFAYLQSLAPVRQSAPSPSVGFPYNLRASLNAWRALYFAAGEYKPDPARSAQWNRGAYLVQGLGHCNECHVARDSLGGLPRNTQLSGGQIPVQNWYAPDLSTQANGGLEGWSEQDIVDLLKTGLSAKGSAFGPMAEVVAQSTQHMSDEDLRAVAGYLQSLPARPAVPAKDLAGGKAQAAQGGKLYEQRCAACHGKDGKGVAGVYPPLDGNSSVNEPTGINAIRVVLLGGFPPVTAGNPRPYSMPPFAQQLNDADVAAVVSYVRQAWSNKAAPVLERDVATYRHTPVD
ncbi:alcohol dehydrogenase [Frateuria sp. Soil773]|uniref:c-type cytochrome n=1 Tax=Frateuria sp. Soil773 TaxID=1736407 RepID=UPI0006FE53C1|nr:cytochrome c [Frateuria sp. Soil773]KRE98604.1 alcohol dehydrogenase [Frateuria sp. Soil773]